MQFNVFSSASDSSVWKCVCFPEELCAFLLHSLTNQPNLLLYLEDFVTFHIKCCKNNPYFVAFLLSECHIQHDSRDI